MGFRIRWVHSHAPKIDNTSRGTEARILAERELARVQAETPYYERLGNDLRRLRERNHFAENIRATLGRP